MKKYFSRLRTLNPKSNLPILIAIPGGPGLSGKSLKGIEVFKSKFQVSVLDPAGTGKTKELPKRETREEYFDRYIEDIEMCLSEFILKHAHSNKFPLTFIGHSYGGIVALEMGLRFRQFSSRVFCLSTPLTQATMNQDVTTAYSAHLTDSLMSAQKAFDKKPSKSNFKKWLANYGTLFFSKHSNPDGRRLMQSDDVSVLSFNRMGGLVHSDTNFYKKVKAAKFVKSMISATEDYLVTSKVLKRDAKATNMNFYAVPLSGHFSLLDQPEAILRIVSDSQNEKRQSTTKRRKQK